MITRNTIRAAAVSALLIAGVAVAGSPASANKQCSNSYHEHWGTAHSFELIKKKHYVVSQIAGAYEWNEKYRHSGLASAIRHNHYNALGYQSC